MATHNDEDWNDCSFDDYMTIRNCLIFQVTKIEWAWPQEMPTLTGINQWHLACVSRQKWDGHIV